MIWQLPPRVSVMPKNSLKNRLIFPWESPSSLLSITTAAWASGPTWLAQQPSGIGGLQGMPALHVFAAAGALADGDMELAIDGLARNLDLILLLAHARRETPCPRSAGIAPAAGRRTPRRSSRAPCGTPWCRNPSPALRPGRLGSVLGSPRENGAACRLAARLRASICSSSCLRRACNWAI